MPIIDNASGGPVTVTFVCRKTCDTAGLLHDLVQTVAAGAREFFPPLQAAFVDPTTGRVKMTYSAVASVTVGVVSP